MADTERSTAALLARAADNNSGDITPQDLRDIIVSALGGYASVYVADGNSPQAVSATAAKLEAFDSDGPASGATPDHSSDAIAIGVTAIYWVEFCCDLEADTAGSYTAELRVDDVAAGGLKSVCEFEASGETRSWRFAGPVSLSAANVLSVYVSGPSANITVKHAQLAVKRIG